MRRAEVFLAGLDGDVPSGDDLTEGLYCVWQALRFADLWPEEIRERAAELVVAMLRHGPYRETARRMTADEAREFVALVRRFVADAEGRQRSRDRDRREEGGRIRRRGAVGAASP